MKKFMILFVCLIFVGNAFGATLTVDAPEEALGMTEIATIEIRLDGLTDTEKTYMGSSGAAFTIEYDENLLYVPDSLNTTFFDTFQAQFTAAGTSPNPYTGPVNGIYSSPVVVNNDDIAGKTMVAAARCTPTSTSSENILFTFQVQLQDTSDVKAGDYNITVKPTILNNTDAGYSADGEPIDVVVGSDPNKQPTDEGAYPVIIAKNMSPVGNSKVTYKADETHPCPGDSDCDGLLDSVETNTGVYVSPQNTGTDPNNEDTDDDGKKDGDEVEHCNPLVKDPECVIPGCVNGDVNGDSEVTAADAVSAFNLSLLPSSSWTEAQK
ncbi:conserved hypothetical protein, secreted, partial [Candidatus Magnetomorum sp. HK-1]